MVLSAVCPIGACRNLASGRRAPLCPVRDQRGERAATKNAGLPCLVPAGRAAAAPGTVFLANRMGLFRSDDRGAHWRDIEVGRFSPLTYGRDLRVSSHDPNVLYAALSPAFSSSDGGIFRSDDVGKTWKRFDHGVKAEATIMAVAVHPRDPQQVVGVSKTGQVFTTGDGGDSWSGLAVRVEASAR